LKTLELQNNQLTSLPESICNLTNLNWSSSYIDVYYSYIYNNQFCSSYPECLVNQEPLTDENDNGIWDGGESFEDTNDNGIYEEDYVGYQDTSECTPCQLGEEGFTEIDGICTLVCDEGLTNVDGECISLNTSESIFPTVYNLSSPYPNPFNPTTSISFSIPQSDIVSLNVYDITGKLVTNLVNEHLNIGYHSINWDGTNQSSGMYLVRMESGEYVETQKLVLVK
jgi:hypothetical protein